MESPDVHLLSMSSISCCMEAASFIWYAALCLLIDRVPKLWIARMWSWFVSTYHVC
jgi:hypothetical protein